MNKITNATSKLRVAKEKKKANAPERVRSRMDSLEHDLAEQESSSIQVPKGSSLLQGSFDSTTSSLRKNGKVDQPLEVKDGNLSDDDSMEFQQLMKGSAAYELVKPTTLIIIDLNGKQTEHVLLDRIQTYAQLQREIARIAGKSRKMYMIQNANGKKLSSENFKPIGFVRAKQIPHIIPRSVLRFRDVDWDFSGYHAEVNRKKAQREADEAAGLYDPLETDD